jgi:PrtD family type I secretion system ABC transporter
MSDWKRNSLADLFRPYARGLISLVFFSFFTSLLYLVPSVYMMQLSERVMLSRNIMTLLFLTAIAVFLLVAMTFLEAARSRAMRRISIDLDRNIGHRVFDTLNRKYVDLKGASKSLILSDVNTFREFVGGPVILYLMDLIWVPMIIGVMFMVHVFLGFTILAVVVITVVLTFANQRFVAEDMARSQAALTKSQEFARAVTNGADVARPLGMLAPLTRRWLTAHNEALGWQFAANERSDWAAGALRFLRNSQQIILMVVGVSLFLFQEVSAGAVFAVVFVGMRAVAPVSAVAGSWRMIQNFLGATERLNQILANQPSAAGKMSLPRPAGNIVVSRVLLTAPNSETVILNDVSFAVRAGRLLGVVGPSGAGKSSLARLLVGTWRSRRGSVLLDDHELAHWDQDELGRYIGYVPQEVDLFPGTVAENISRFRDEGTVDFEAVLEAAELAGVQDIIQALPEGYNTIVGPGGYVFSGGQKQRIALARAVYGNPSFIVLDEPNSNLDVVGEQGLGRTLTMMRNRGATVVIITHRLNMLQFCDDVLVMNAGTVQAVGPRDTILGRLPSYRPASPVQLEAVAR